MFQIHSIESSPPETSFIPEGEKQIDVTLSLQFRYVLNQLNHNDRKLLIQLFLFL